MSHRQRKRRRPSIWLLVMLLCACSSFLGWGLTQAQRAAATDLVRDTPVAQVSESTPVDASSPVGTVDAVPQNLQLAQEVYLERCGTCHIAVPPAVLPSQVWRNLIQDQGHYSVTLPPLYNPELALTWKYLRTFSRLANQDEQLPSRIARSRYFKILHPRVEFSEPITLGTCVSCHPSADQFNFRNLTTEWQDAP